MAKTWADETANVMADLASYQKVLEEKSFTKRATFLDKYGSGWNGLKYWKQEIKATHANFSPYAYGTARVEPLDLEKAKPFIRAVIERMLDLLQSEENWIKGKEYTVTEDGVEQFCLIGAKARALKDLQLGQIQGEEEVERQRQRVLATVERFLNDTLSAEKGFGSMPGFNDTADTTFEDVRLWLKSCLTRLED